MVKKKGKNAKGKGGQEGATGPSTVAEASTSRATPEQGPVAPPSAQYEEAGPHRSEGAAMAHGEGRGRGQGRGQGRGRGGRMGEQRPPGAESEQAGDVHSSHQQARSQQQTEQESLGQQQQPGLPQQEQAPRTPQHQGQRGGKGAGKRDQRGPPQPGAGPPSPGPDAGPTPSEGPQRFQATTPSRTTLEAKPVASDQKMVSIQKGLADMSVSGVGSGDKTRTSGIQAVSMQIPHRKSYALCGTSGRKSKVLTNHLALNLDSLAKMTVIHYDVTIEPDKPKRLMRLAINAAKKLLFEKRFPAFDGKKNLYSSGQLPFGREARVEVKVWDEERERDKDYIVSIKQVAQIDMSCLTNYMKLAQNKAPKPVPQTAIQALDIILRTAPAYRMVQVGRSFFSQPKGQIHSLGNGLEVWHGIFQSAIIGWKPFINIDVAHKGFPKAQNCVNLIDDLCRTPYGHNQGPDLHNELGMMEKDSLMKFLRELKVNYEIPNNPTSKRTYRVNGIGKSARTQRFAMEDGSEMSVEEYYAKIKKFKLRFPNMPVLDVGSPTRIKKIYIPLELCTVKEGQVVIKKMNELQTAEMIKVAATSSDDRKRKIMDAIKTIDFNSDPCVGNEFKVSVAKDFEVVESRVLDPPSLLYGMNKEVMPNKGVWFAGQFFEGKSLAKWTILNLARIQDQDLQNFAEQMQTNGRKAGMKIEPPMHPFQCIQLSRRMENLKRLEELFTDFKAKGMQLVFCVVEEKGDAYAQVKRMAELKIGVLTQCVKAVTIQRRMRSPATANNILMKVNSKLNGKNHCFTTLSRPKILATPVIILGADVTHPPPDQTNTPSVAAVCASHDPKAFQYNLQYRLQPPRMEIIEDLEEIMKEQLRFFYKKNKQKPQKIIFYRDGVSEGQFNEVLNVEFMAIRRACKSLQADYEPGITFLVVQKRHHTRFFPDPRNNNPHDHDGRNNNVPAGTIVDTIITHPTDMDFYLVSHASIQGVSRPTKYRRLWDDNDIPEDELELLTYYLCHLFSRCTRSVSYPAPTYYAHLAAYRVRCYLEMGQVSLNNLAKEQDARKIQDCILKEFPMFFV